MSGNSNISECDAMQAKPSTLLATVVNSPVAPNIRAGLGVQFNIRALKTTSVLALACAGLFAQHAPASATFEVASVKPAAPRTNERFSSAIGGDPGRIDYRNVSIKMMIMQAYGVEDYQVDGPEWLATIGFDVIATSAPARGRTR